MDTLLRLDERQLRLLGFGLVALVAAAMFSWSLLPQFRGYTAAKNLYTLLSQTASVPAPPDSQLTALEEEVTRLERLLNGDTANLPLQQMEPFVIGRLQSISWRNGIDLIGVEPRQGAPTGQFNELVFDVNLRGNYFGFYNWLKQVNDELGFVVVKRFRMLPAGEAANGAEPELSLKLTLASYRSQAS